MAALSEQMGILETSLREQMKPLASVVFDHDERPSWPRRDDVKSGQPFVSTMYKGEGARTCGDQEVIIDSGMVHVVHSTGQDRAQNFQVREDRLREGTHASVILSGH